MLAQLRQTLPLGNHSYLSSFAAGPSGTGWATSMTHIGSGSDYTIYWYNGAGTWTLENGGGVQIDQNLWMVANMPWASGSNDYAIFQMVQFNSPGDNAWALMPGGARQISISPSGNPWITNYEHVAFQLESFAP